MISAKVALAGTLTKETYEEERIRLERVKRLEAQRFLDNTVDAKIREKMREGKRCLEITVAPSISEYSVILLREAGYNVTSRGSMTVPAIIVTIKW